jgi:F-type H+-transporting ATPase subunit epsilon
MAKTLAVEIVTPDRLVLGQEADSVTLSGVAGEFTVLPLHIPFLSALAIGSVVIRRGGVASPVFVSGGFADVTADKVLILAEAAELPAEIDAERARKAMERAAVRLAAEQREKIDYVRAKAALQRAVVRLKLHELSGRGLGSVSAGIAR